MPANVVGNRIVIQFAYNPKIIEVVKSLPDRRWDAQERVWWVPASAYNARAVIDTLDGIMNVGRDIQILSKKDQIPTAYDESLVDQLSVGDLVPYPFQLVTVPFLNRLHGRALICDEVGLGKTIEAIIWARHRKIDSLLVVAPASVVYKWEVELKRWYPEIARQVQVITSGKDVIEEPVNIISYDLMVRKADDLQDRYRLIVFDEFHKIKNHKTKRFKAARQIALGVPHLLGLSGTPILNRPIEMYNILHLLDPVIWNWKSYAMRYCWTEREGYKGSRNLTELEERLRGTMIRRFKREVSDQMPSFTRTIVPFELSPEERSLYTKLFIEDPATIRSVFPDSKGYFANSLDWLSAMRIWLEYLRSGRVIDWARDYLESSDSKLIIYAEFRRTHQYLLDELYEYGVLRITGEVAQDKRQEIIDRWQTDSRERVMLLSSAGGEGIDLFGKGGIQASTLVFAGRAWGPSQEEQIEGRVDRTGQLYPVEAVYLVAQNTLDVDINDLINTKRIIIKDSVRIQEKESIIGDLFSILQRQGKTIIYGGKHE